MKIKEDQSDKGEKANKECLCKKNLAQHALLFRTYLYIIMCKLGIIKTAKP
jgi:hypothetical protein